MHVCNDVTNFVHYKPDTSEQITLANGQKIKAKGRGSVQLNCLNDKGEHGTLNLSNVLYVPELKKNLLSVKELTSQGYSVTFVQDTAETACNNVILAVAKYWSNMYKLQLSDKMQSLCSVSVSAKPGSQR